MVAINPSGKKNAITPVCSEDGVMVEVMELADMVGENGGDDTISTSATSIFDIHFPVSRNAR